MTSFIASTNSSSVSFADRTAYSHLEAVPVKNATEKNNNSTDEGLCVVCLVRKPTPRSETMVRARNFCEGIQLLATHKALVLKRVALVVQGIEDTAPGITFSIQVANLSLSCTTLPKRMKATSSVAQPQSWFGSEPTEHKPDTLNVVQLYKVSQTNEKILHQHYDTKQ